MCTFDLGQFFIKIVDFCFLPIFKVMILLTKVLLIVFECLVFILKYF
jgi:hypothetical protein